MLRLISSILLALVLALTSQSMAVVRGASAATGQMVLCTGTGPMVVYVDATGAPTSAPHLCPDAAFHASLGTVAPTVLAPQHVIRFDHAPWHPLNATPVLPPVMPPARAPPLTV